MRRRRDLARDLLYGLCLVLLFAAGHFVHREVSEGGLLSLSRAREATFMTATLAIFAALAMVRLVVFMLASFGDHLLRAKSPGSSGHHPLVSIVVPVFDEGPCVEAALRSLLRLRYSQIEIIVVDDGSRDDTLERALRVSRAEGGGRIRVFSKANAGKAKALNYGIERASGEILMAVDGDSVVEEGALAAALPHFTDPDVGAVAGYVRVVNTRSVLCKLQLAEYVVGLNLVRRAQGLFGAVGTVPGPIGIFRRSALRRVGGYDSDTFAEDCDLTMKLLADGWKVVFEPEAVSCTEAPESLVALMKQRYRWARGILQTLRKHRRLLLDPRRSEPATVVLWLTVLEAVVWPVINSLGLVSFVLALSQVPAQGVAVGLWTQLMLLEAIVLLASLGPRERRNRYVLLSPLVRLVFQVVLDVTRVLANAEELLRLHMSWGKLERRGRL